MLSCQQPSYFPWLGYFEQIYRSEKFVFLDSVQWTKQGTQHRARIPAAANSNESQWLTIPVNGHGHRTKTLKDMKIDHSQAWEKSHWKTIQTIYGKAPHFKTQIEPVVRPFFEKIADEPFLIEVCQQSTFLFWDAFGLTPELFWSSELSLEGTATDRLVSLCSHLGESEYYSALGSTPYMDLSAFRNNGIRVRWQHFRPYLQVDRPIHFSVLDWLAFETIEEIRKRIAGPKIFLETTSHLMQDSAGEPNSPQP